MRRPPPTRRAGQCRGKQLTSGTVQEFIDGTQELPKPLIRAQGLNVFDRSVIIDRSRSLPVHPVRTRKWVATGRCGRRCRAHPLPASQCRQASQDGRPQAGGIQRACNFVWRVRWCVSCVWSGRPQVRRPKWSTCERRKPNAWSWCSCATLNASEGLPCQGMGVPSHRHSNSDRAFQKPGVRHHHCACDFLCLVLYRNQTSSPVLPGLAFVSGFPCSTPLPEHASPDPTHGKIPSNSGGRALCQRRKPHRLGPNARPPPNQDPRTQSVRRAPLARCICGQRRRVVVVVSESPKPSSWAAHNGGVGVSEQATELLHGVAVSRDAASILS